jgi:hypothetical protein
LYLIQTFRDRAQIVRLVRTILRSDPKGAVLISHNRESFELAEADFAGFGEVHVMQVQGGSRVDLSVAAGYLAAIERARASGIAYDWVINLTGQCYPARPLRELVCLLSQAQVDAFIDHRQIFGRHGAGIWPYEEAHNRYHYQYHWRLTRTEPPPLARKVLGALRVLLHRAQPWVRIDTSYALQIGVRDRSGIINDDFPLFGGHFFMTLSRKAAEYLLHFATANPEITAHIGRMNIPCEVFPHTVLGNNAELRLSGEAHFYWDVEGQKRGRPRILTMADLEAIEASGAFFARKFELAIDSEVLDRLDARVLGDSGARLSNAPASASQPFAA